MIKASADIEAEIFVVDNNSTDGSKDYLENKFPQVIFKWNNSNEGFAKANNSIIKEVKGRQVIFLNPDTIIPEDCFKKCIGFFHLHEDCGALGVRMIDGSGKYLKESKRSFPSALASFFKLAGVATLFPESQTFAKYYAGHLSEKENNEVDVLAGAFIMLSRPVLNETKGFDEDYFMYGEDIDLSYRIQKTGYKNYYFADSCIIHFKGESTQKNSYHYIRTFYAAMKMFVNKHYKEKKGTALLMNVSIGFNKLIASAVLFIKKITIIKPGRPRPIQTAVISGQQRFDEMIHLIRYSTIPLIINGRIAVDKSDTGIAVGRIEDTERLIVKMVIDQLIFCEGELSYKEIIEKTEQLSMLVEFLFHSNGSSSIVGSNNKNGNGFFIAKQ